MMQTRADLYKYLDYHAYEAEARCTLRQRQRPQVDTLLALIQ